MRLQYDALRIEHDLRAVEIVVSNRAIRVFTTDSEALREEGERGDSVSRTRASAQPPNSR